MENNKRKHHHAFAMESIRLQHVDHSERPNFHADFNFEEPFDFALENYGKESSRPNLDRFGNQVIEQEDLTMPSLHDEDYPYVTAYTGYEKSYQELLAASDARSNSLTTAQSTPNAMPGRLMPTFKKAAPSMITGDMSNTNMDPAHLDATFMADPVMASPSTAAPTTGNAQKTNTMTPVKKTCTLCAKRKIMCQVVEGTHPKVCEFCKKKGVSCVFEQRKEYPTRVTTKS